MRRSTYKTHMCAISVVLVGKEGAVSRMRSFQTPSCVCVCESDGELNNGNGRDVLAAGQASSSSFLSNLVLPLLLLLHQIWSPVNPRCIQLDSMWPSFLLSSTRRSSPPCYYSITSLSFPTAHSEPSLAHRRSLSSYAYAKSHSPPRLSC